MTDRPPAMPGFDYEKSHGEVRPPTRPRISDLTAPTEEQRRRNHEANGRFGKKNTAARGRGAKAIVRARIRAGIVEGVEDSADVARIVEDAFTSFCAALRELPSDGQHVRSLLAFKCTHEALAAWWQAQAYKRGLGTPESIEAEDRYAMHTRRVEQLTASVLGASKALASVARHGESLPDWFTQATAKESKR